jgi:hypothetical protein
MIKNIGYIIVGLLFIVGCESVTIPAEVNAPVANDDTVNAVKAQKIDIEVLKNDTDSDGSIDKTSVTIVVKVKHGKTEVDKNTGKVAYTSDGNFTGDDTFTYKVKDNNGALSNEATVTIHVKEATNTTNVVSNTTPVPTYVPITVTPTPNQRPTARHDNIVLDNNETILIDILKNDTDSDGIIDKNSVVLTTIVTHGKMSIESNGTIKYTPDANYVGEDFFKYRVKDNNGAYSNIATVGMTIRSSIKTILLAQNDSVETLINKSIIINVLSNDLNNKGTFDKKSVVIVKKAGHGNVFVSSTEGTMTYVANTDYVGKDSFTYKVKNDKGIYSNEATVTITIKEAENKAPVATNDSVKLEDVNILEVNVLANDNDSDGSLIPASVEIVSDVTYGSLRVNSSTGMITYALDDTYTGIDTFTYRVKDNKGVYSNIATVTIDIVSVRLDKSKGIESKAKEWYVRIVMEDTTNNMKTESTQLGKLEGDDVVVKHSLKAIAPFGKSSFLDVVFKNPVGVDAGEYKSNFHAASTDADSWEFTVKSHDDNATMILSWRGLYVLAAYTDTEGREQYNEYRSLVNPLLAYMTLIDTKTNEKIQILKNGEVKSYVFNMEGNKERTFRWELKDSTIPLASPLLVTVPSAYKAKLKKLQVKVLRKDAKATPDAHTKKRVERIDMLTPPTFEVLVK